jgi:hypothetical protein
MILAIDAAWVAVIATGLGALIGFVGSWLAQRSELSERLEERSRAERKKDYSGFLTAAEDSVHRFEWLAGGHFTDAGGGTQTEPQPTSSMTRRSHLDTLC